MNSVSVFLFHTTAPPRNFTKCERSHASDFTTLFLSQPLLTLAKGREITKSSDCHEFTLGRFRYHFHCDPADV